MINALNHLKPDHMIQGDNVIFRADDVQYIDVTDIANQLALVKLRSMPDSRPTIVSGFNALELVWILKSGALEGKRIKFPKYSWAVHNLVAHPIMQLLAFCGLYQAAMWIHDVTVPKPSNAA